VTDREFWLFTLGQNHVHRYASTTLDCDGVVKIFGDYKSARDRMVEICGRKWSHQYAEKDLYMGYFRRGIVLTLDS